MNTITLTPISHLQTAPEGMSESKTPGFSR